MKSFLVSCALDFDESEECRTAEDAARLFWKRMLEHFPAVRVSTLDDDEQSQTRREIVELDFKDIKKLTAKTKDEIKIRIPPRVKEKLDALAGYYGFEPQTFYAWVLEQFSVSEEIPSDHKDRKVTA